MDDRHRPAGTAVQYAARAALEIVPFAMLIADGSAQALAVNDKWLELSRLSKPASLRSGWLNVLDPDSRVRVREDALRVAAGGGLATADYQLEDEALRRWTRWWISRHELDGVPLLAIAVADVHDDHAKQADLYYRATHDSLTGLINRSLFVESTDQALRRNERHGKRVGVVFVDLDGFKRVNDVGGHSLGDRVLYAIGARLRHSVRNADLVARIGGDEFAVLCEDLTATEQAEAVARRISAALGESVELDGESWAMAASVGAAVNHGPPDTAEDLLDRADRAMYAMKSTRRRAISSGFARPDDPPPAPRGGVAVATEERPTIAVPTGPEPTANGVAHPRRTDNPVTAARHHLVSDMLALCDSLDSVRDRLGRLACTEHGIIEICERQDAGGTD